MRRKILGVCAALLFLSGLCLLLYPHVSSWLYQRHSVAENKAYHTAIWGLSQEVCDALWADAEAYNQRLAEKTDQFSLSDTERAETAAYLNPMDIGQMGYVSIPKIDVEIPIYQGTEEPQLQAGAGWWIGTSLPTGGESTHCVLAAHNGLVKAKMFTDLDQLVVGDTFYLTILDRVLTYEVDQILVTEPGDHDPLRIVPGEDLVTLYTCTPYGINTHRLLVRGTRVETPVSEDSQPSRWIQAAPFAAAALVIFLLAVLLLHWVTHIRYHGKREAPKYRIFSRKRKKK